MRALFSLIPSLLLAAIALPVRCETQTAQAQALLTTVRQELESTVPKGGLAPQDNIRFVVGNQIWQPGKQFVKGADWLALTCSAQGCTLEPANLEIKSESWQGHYDDRPTRGQKLTFKKTVPSNGKVVVWLRTTGAPAWLKSGVVPTYHSTAMRLKQPQTVGTLETLVELPSGESATLVPMLLREKNETWSWPSFLLQLRSGDRRQFLAGEFGTCSKTVATNYLQWAGDLDGDGKPDYLVSFVDDDGPIHLYLSSGAKDKFLVGLAGIYNAPPYGGECDTSGWLSSSLQ